MAGTMSLFLPTGIGMRGFVLAAVAIQIGLACALLVLSSLVIRSVVNQQHINYGYDTGAVLAARVGLFSTDDYPGEPDRRKFYERVLRQLRSTPGVGSVFTLFLPLTYLGGTTVKPASGNAAETSLPLKVNVVDVADAPHANAKE